MLDLQEKCPFMYPWMFQIICIYISIVLKSICNYVWILFLENDKVSVSVSGYFWKYVSISVYTESILAQVQTTNLGVNFPTLSRS